MTLDALGLRAAARERPLQVQPIWTPDPSQPDVFNLCIHFTNGALKSWHVDAPKVPITESWIREALTHLIERITNDLRFGFSQPECRPDKQAFQEFDRHSEALTRDLHSMLCTWATWRIEHYRKNALPAWKFREDPDADTGVDSGWRPPVIKGEEPPGGWSPAQVAADPPASAPDPTPDISSGGGGDFSGGGASGDY